MSARDHAAETRLARAFADWLVPRLPERWGQTIRDRADSLAAATGMERLTARQVLQGNPDGWRWILPRLPHIAAAIGASECETAAAAIGAHEEFLDLQQRANHRNHDRNAE